MAEFAIFGLRLTGNRGGAYASQPTRPHPTRGVCLLGQLANAGALGARPAQGRVHVSLPYFAFSMPLRQKGGRPPLLA